MHDRSDFQRRWAQAERSHRRYSRVIFAFGIFVFLLAMAIIGLIAYGLFHPHEVGAWFHSLIAGATGEQ